jgi:hypothetical protein
MPASYSGSLCYQIWFYEGVQSAMDGEQPRGEFEMRRSYGNGITNSYLAGYQAWEQMGEMTEKPAQIDIPEEFAKSTQEKAWFSLGVEDARAGNDFETLVGSTRMSSVLFRAYQAGYTAGKQG